MKAANDNSPTLNTAFLLLAQYNGKAVIPLADVCRDFFGHLEPGHFGRKIDAGEIKLPMVRIEASAKSARGIHLQDLADYIDTRRLAAIRELKQLAG